MGDLASKLLSPASFIGACAEARIRGLWALVAKLIWAHMATDTCESFIYVHVQTHIYMYTFVYT